MSKLKINDLLDLRETIASGVFDGLTYVWEVLPILNEYILELGALLSENEYSKIGEDIWISRTAKVAPTASVAGPTIIGHNAEVRHCAYIRGSVIVGESAIVGNSTELKNTLLFNEVQVPHYNYVGDSILGYKAHIGAGGITSNMKSDKSLISVNVDGECFETSLRKFGTILGDNVEIGCNSVLNPGSIVGRGSNIYPLSMVRGYVPPNSIYKRQGEVVIKR